MATAATTTAAEPAAAATAPATAATAATAAATAATAATNTIDYTKLGDEVYTSMNQFKKTFGLTTEEAIQVRPLFDPRTGLLNTVLLTNEQKDLVLKALNHRINSITHQLLEVGRYTLIKQSLRDTKSVLEKIRLTIGHVDVVASTGVKKTVNTAKQENLSTKLMTILLKIGYFATHPDMIKSQKDIEGWNKFLNATAALTERGNLLNTTTNTVEEAAPYTISKQRMTNPTPTKQYKTITEYIKAMTKVSKGQTAYETQVGAMLNAMVLYQFIEETDKENFKQNNTTKLQTVGTKVKDRLKTRFSNSMMVVVEQYKQLFGLDVYAAINQEQVLNLFKSPLQKTILKTPSKAVISVQTSLEILEGIVTNVYTKLYSSDPTTKNKALGIYKFDKPLSNQLLPLLQGYTERVKGTGITADILEKTTKSVFVWFVGGDVISSSITPIVVPSIGSASSALPLDTFTNFIKTDKNDSVFMIVHDGYTSTIDSCFALLHTYPTTEPANIEVWNTVIMKQFPFPTPAASTSTPFGFGAPPPPPAPLGRAPSGPPVASILSTGGPFFRAISITSKDIPDFTIKSNLCLPMFQFMTTLAALNQSASPANRYADLTLPVP